jgi:hypothetical protein
MLVVDPLLEEANLHEVSAMMRLLLMLLLMLLLLLLCSLQDPQQAVGITLTCACHMVVVDPLLEQANLHQVRLVLLLLLLL